MATGILRFITMRPMPIRFSDFRDVGGPPPSNLPDMDGISDILLGRRVLIVEDEALLAFELELAVSDLGGEVIGPAYSLAQAQQLLADSTIDGAILDVDLAGKDVFPVAHDLHMRGVPFVFHTGHGSRDELTKLFPGAVVCQKPTPTARLFAHLASLMKGPEERPS